MTESLKLVQQRSKALEEFIDTFDQACESFDEEIVSALASYLKDLQTLENNVVEHVRAERANRIKPLHAQESQTHLHLAEWKRHSSSATPGTVPLTRASYLLRLSEIKISHYGADTMNARSIKLPLLGLPTSVHPRITTPDQRDWIFSGFFPINRNVKALPTKVEINVSEPGQVTSTESKSTILKAGKEGLGDLLFRRPWGLTVHPTTGDIYIADQWNGRLCVMSPDLKWITSAGSTGNGPLQMDCPCGLSVSLNNIVSVVDYSNRRVQQWKTTKITSTPADGTASVALEHLRSIKENLSNPVCSAVDLSGTFYFTNIGAKQVPFFSEEGQYLDSLKPPTDIVLLNVESGSEKFKSIDLEGLKQKELNDCPYSVCVDDLSRVLVMWRGGSCVHAYSAVSKEYIGSFAVIESSPGYPTYLSRGPEGGFVLSDEKKRHVYFYSSDGVLLHEMEASTPIGVSFGPSGAFYLNECNEHHIVRM